jgi:hypothetical protein
MKIASTTRVNVIKFYELFMLLVYTVLRNHKINYIDSNNYIQFINITEANYMHISSTIQ